MLKNKLKVYVYELPGEFSPSGELALVSQTYHAIYNYVCKNLMTRNPAEADAFLVPINLIEFQFRKEDPISMLRYLKYLDTQKPHFIIALGDFSQRSRKNHFGEAYPNLYKWIKNFNLLALESTSDLITGKDIGIIPYNTLSATPKFNSNPRPFLYSFLGETHHQHLPANHIRNKLNEIPVSSDTFIGKQLSFKQRVKLMRNYICANDQELIARNSVFTLCPAGYGRWTYRFFQAIEWGSIPILLSDDYIKPFSDVIPYDDFSITLPERAIGGIDEVIRAIDPLEIKAKQIALMNNQHNFSQKAFFKLLEAKMIEVSQ